jgi:hypothetical protein
MTIAVITIRMKTGRVMATRVSPILARTLLQGYLLQQRRATAKRPWQDGNAAALHHCFDHREQF